MVYFKRAEFWHRTGTKQWSMAGLNRAINAGSTFCGVQASSSRHRRWPEPRQDLDRNEDPTPRLLITLERANIVGLKLFGSEASDPSVIESTTQ